MSGINDAAEGSVREACQAQDFAAACTAALEAYGAEVLSFLMARLRSQSDGEEAFSMFAENLWKALPGFEFRCSVRGFMYTLARNTANRYATAPHNRRERNLTVTGHASVSAMIEHVRSVTHIYQKTEVKDRVRALREQLADDDQTLLILHVDRALPWREIAMVMHEEGEQIPPEMLDRESARLRKRFERLKAELRRLAVEEGLLQR